MTVRGGQRTINEDKLKSLENKWELQILGEDGNTVEFVPDCVDVHVDKGTTTREEYSSLTMAKSASDVNNFYGISFTRRSKNVRSATLLNA